VEFRLLGPIEVRDGDEVLGLGGPRQRLVLAHLVLHANHVVSTDRLIRLTWGDDPPEAARQALFAYVSRLRKLLGADRIVARPPGYVLVAEPDEIDVRRFIDAVAAARDLPDDERSALSRLTEALDLWRGDALSDLSDYEQLRPEIARLEDLRLGAIEDQLRLQIDLGQHRDAVPVLERLVEEHPLREGLRGQLLLALYRSGRQADALAAYQRFRELLLEELGVDPSPELRHLQEQILRQDPALESASQAGPDIGAQAVAPGDAGPAPSRPGRDRRFRTVLVAGAALGVLVVAAVVASLGAGGSPVAGRPTTWTIAASLSLTGPDAGRGLSVRNAVELAVDDVNLRGGVAGVHLAVRVEDDAQDPDRAAANAAGFVADTSVVAMIGPWGSGPTFAVLPTTNRSGLLECSPSATHPGLTKPRDGALDLRSAHPDDINFVRLAPADDIQAVALASFAFHDLGARLALVVDDTGVGRVIADPFEAEFRNLGGSTVRLALNPGAAPRTVLARLTGDTPPDLVFFGGETDTGAAAVRRAMARSGFAGTPFLSWDPLLDGDGRTPGSFIARVGARQATGSYVAHAALPDHRSSFAEAYRQRFGAEPDEYAAAGYACVEIISAVLGDVAGHAASPTEARPLVRAAVADPAARFETVLGTVGFDTNGDARQQFVTFYRVEASAGNGSGGWVISKKQDFGPAP